MNRSFRAPERGVQASVKQRPQLGSVRTSTMKEKEEDLALFLEMRKLDKERMNNLHNSEEFDAPLGSTTGSSPIFDIETTTPTRKNGADDFLNSENDKNDYEWLLTPPGTPLFSSLETDSPKTVRSLNGSPKARPTALIPRLANSQPGPAARSNLGPKQSPASSPSLNNNSSTGTRRPSSSGGPGSRSVTPSTRTTLTKSKPTPKPTPSTTPKPTPTTASQRRPVRSSTPTPRSTTLSAKSTLPARSSTPTPRSTIPSTTKSTLPARTSTPSVRSTARSSTPMARTSVPASKPTVRAPTPIRRPTNTSAPPIRSPSAAKSVSSMARNSVPSPASSPNVKPRPWKPSEMPGYSLDAPPNLRTSLPGRPVSATRGRAGAPSVRSSSVDPVSNGRVRRQSCSPSRGRTPNVSGSSVPALSRLQSKANDNMSPVLYGTKMVERVINMRKLAPPKQDDKHSPHSNLSGKSSSSPDNAGFGRTLSKKSLDMAIRHMDIRQRVPGNLRPLMANIPASSMYGVRLGPTQNRPVSISESPHATNSNASSEMSVNNNGVCFNGSQVDDDINSDDKGVGSPAGMQGR